MIVRIARHFAVPLWDQRTDQHTENAHREAEQLRRTGAIGIHLFQPQPSAQPEHDRHQCALRIRTFPVEPSCEWHERCDQRDLVSVFDHFIDRQRGKKREQRDHAGETEHCDAHAI